MFQDTLLIIKPNYLLKRKALLLYLLRKGFIIKGQRKTKFSPELAAEFYQDRSKEPNFMFQVILLSKGNSEAFILSKECAVQELINAVVCYFGNSAEMEQNIHVTQCSNRVQREISFIFANYIHEPVLCPEQVKLNNPLVEATIGSLYDIITNPEKDPHKNWTEKLAESLRLASKTLPRITNQCCYNSRLNTRNVAQQTKITCLKYQKEDGNSTEKSLLPDLNKDCSSLNITTSSCVSCSGFCRGTECVGNNYQQSLEHVNRTSKVPLNAGVLSTGSTVNAVKERVFKKLNIEEPIAGAEFSEFQKHQVLCADLSDKGEETLYFEDAVINEQMFVINKDSYSQSNLLYPDNKPPDVESLHSATKELSIENTTMKSEKISPVTQEYKKIHEEIMDFLEEIVAAKEDNCESEQGVRHMP